MAEWPRAMWRRASSDRVWALNEAEAKTINKVQVLTARLKILTIAVLT